eukprot:TRINITY_DN34248_c0_g1_i1.p1 TRINITY_DN34248_c0_g1~~TRINITY_DN34248_c0_g1_i1.p1  ORF type:complete len:572 (+),score=125.07 TRINITY_DN34248_c0_g1_i1:24-1739(+)
MCAQHSLLGDSLLLSHSSSESLHGTWPPEAGHAKHRDASCSEGGVESSEAENFEAPEGCHSAFYKLCSLQHELAELERRICRHTGLREARQQGCARNRHRWVMLQRQRPLSVRARFRGLLPPELAATVGFDAPEPSSASQVSRQPGVEAFRGDDLGSAEAAPSAAASAAGAAASKVRKKAGRPNLRTPQPHRRPSGTQPDRSPFSLSASKEEGRDGAGLDDLLCLSALQARQRLALARRQGAAKEADVRRKRQALSPMEEAAAAIAAPEVAIERQPLDIGVEVEVPVGSVAHERQPLSPGRPEDTAAELSATAPMQADSKASISSTPSSSSAASPAKQETPARHLVVMQDPHAQQQRPQRQPPRLQEPRQQSQQHHEMHQQQEHEQQQDQIPELPAKTEAISAGVRPSHDALMEKINNTRWKSKGAGIDVGEIKNGILRWQPAFQLEASEISAVGPETLSMCVATAGSSSASTYTGETRLVGGDVVEITWSDGDVWVRDSAHSPPQLQPPPQPQPSPQPQLSPQPQPPQHVAKHEDTVGDLLQQLGQDSSSASSPSSESSDDTSDSDDRWV